MPIFRVKSVKIYTGQKKFTRRYSWRSWQISGMNMSYACQLMFTRVMRFTNMFRFDLLWPVGVPNASDFLKCRASSNPSHPARLLHILVIIPQYASKGYHEVILCLPGALQYCWSYCQNGPPSKMWSPRSRAVQCGRGDMIHHFCLLIIDTLPEAIEVLSLQKAWYHIILAIKNFLGMLITSSKNWYYPLFSN